MLEIAITAAGFSFIAIVISAISLNKNSKFDKAIIELSIFDQINHAKEKTQDWTRPLIPLIAKEEKTNADREMIKAYSLNLNASVENCLNAYESACAQYDEGRVNKERFKKDHKDDIRKLVENEVNKKYFNPSHTSSYKAILKVYEEWENLEK